MSEELEQVFKSFMSNQVPKMWSAKSYPSLKSLGSWVHDLELRLDFISVSGEGDFSINNKLIIFIFGNRFG